MTWIDERAKFQKRFDELSQENVQGLITELNKAVGNYIAHGGISQNPNNNPDYNTIIKLTTRAENIKSQYAKLNDDILKFLAGESKDNDLAGLLKENGEVQKQIHNLEKIQKEIKIDVETAIARDELLRSRNTDVTSHQLFLLGRPIRRGLIPYLWVISILFIGVGLIVFKMTMPSFGIGATGVAVGNQSILGLVLDFFSNKVVLISLLISALIVILFLSLKVAGVFGK